MQEILETSFLEVHVFPVKKNQIFPLSCSTALPIKAICKRDTFAIIFDRINVYPSTENFDGEK